MSVLTDVWGFLTTGDHWRGGNGIAARGAAHLWISFVALSIASAIAVPMALWLGHRRRLPGVSVAIANLGRALPTFAIIALVLPISIALGFGLGFWPTCIALVALGIPPLFTNTYAGIYGADAAMLEAASAIGMTDSQILRQVEIPSALPLMITGLRISAVQIVATATLGALVGYQCLGSFIIEGLAQPTRAQARLIAGAFLVAAISIMIDALISRAEHLLIPWKQRSSRIGWRLRLR